MTDCVLLTVEESYKADAAASAGGVPSIELMEAAGAAIVGQIRQRWSPRPVAVLCGPGNNGGDGFVVARLLRSAGWPVSLALLGQPENLKGDAAVNLGRWAGDVLALEGGVVDGCHLLVDALFGAGLARPLEGAAKAVVEAVNRRTAAGEMECLSVDIPSGVHGATGQALGEAVRGVGIAWCRVRV